MTDVDPRVTAVKGLARKTFARPKTEPPRRAGQPEQRPSWRLAWTRGAAIAGLMLALITVEASVKYDKQKILKERGVDTTAILVGKEVRHGKGGPYYSLVYRFTRPGAPGGTEQSSEDTTPARFDRLAPGDAIPVTYDPQEPDRNDLNFDRVVHTRDPARAFDVFYFALPAAVFVTVLAAVMFRRSPERRPIRIRRGRPVS
jgi:hypothetical protein